MDHSKRPEARVVLPARANPATKTNVGAGILFVFGMGKDIDADGHELVNGHIVFALVDLWG